ncbi:MAG: O-methyltransferase [Planctomycetota bacterium]
MSQQSTRLSGAHYEYIAAHTRQQDAFLTELKREALKAGIPAIAIAPEQASFIQILLRGAGAREVVEVGTLAGYSSISMARALPPEGRVTTIEYEPRHADFAEAWIARSDVAGKVRVLRGAGVDVLPTLADRSADAAFLDADKVNYGRYLEECLRIVRPGGLILVDNALAFGRLLDPEDQTESVAAIRAFNETMASHPRLHGVIVPLGDGMWVSHKRD